MAWRAHVALYEAHEHIYRWEQAGGWSAGSVSIQPSNLCQAWLLVPLKCPPPRRAPSNEAEWNLPCCQWGLSWAPQATWLRWTLGKNLSVSREEARCFVKVSAGRKFPAKFKGFARLPSDSVASSPRDFFGVRVIIPKNDYVSQTPRNIECRLWNLPAILWPDRLQPHVAQVQYDGDLLLHSNRFLFFFKQLI